MGKFNEEQLRTVLEFMTTNPVMLQKRNRTNNKSRMSLWKELAEKLNTQGPPYKSEIDWRRSWAKKKFEMGRVKKRRVSLYADLDNLLAKASEMHDSRSGEDSDEDFEVVNVKREPRDEDPLQIGRNIPKVRQKEAPRRETDGRPKIPKMEVLDTGENTMFDDNPNGVSEDQTFPQVTEPKRRKQKPPNPATYAESSSSSVSPEPQERSRKVRGKGAASEPENSVELFFKSLAMEVNKAGLSSEKIFNLEWSVLKVVSEKIKEFTEAEVQPAND
ncbi:uncharacterized protein LOC129789937 [Lutzomyia longipalpis]|uniref:uncharacterized protein LOC129789937 n=1 Tax=Lutzomyia longipalpis TaxID=7200 RepID=UPI002483AF04|nr:uncharacterized protein LOC129789937 [Lutzomyia longipalpis]